MYITEVIYLKASLNLLSQKPGEIENFLYDYYQQNIIINECIFKWSCFYKSSVDMIEILSTLIDNAEKYEISSSITIGGSEPIVITEKNLNELIKVLYLFS